MTVQAIAPADDGAGDADPTAPMGVKASLKQYAPNTGPPDEFDHSARCMLTTPADASRSPWFPMRANPRICGTSPSGTHQT